MQISLVSWPSWLNVANWHWTFLKRKFILFFYSLTFFSVPYISARYFQEDLNGLHRLTTKFGTYLGTKLRIGLDEHETKFHAKFNNIKNRNKHRFLLNGANGQIVGDNQVYYLKFQVIPFEENIELRTESIDSVGHRLVKQHFRKWIHVSDICAINVNLVHVDGHEIFVSDTSQYLPCWLREPTIYSDEFIEIPEDAPLSYGPFLSDQY